jgi:cytidine deaminase
MVFDEVCAGQIIITTLHWSQSMGKKLATGENSYKQARNGCGYSTHAEMAVIFQLMKSAPRKGRKRIDLDLIVVRVNKCGSLSNSKPCAKCLKYLERLNQTSCYRVRDVYYSDSNGQVICVKFNELVKDVQKHVTRRFR